METAEEPEATASLQGLPPGAYLLTAGDLPLNTGRPTVRLLVRNRGDRPIQVGSHYHFFEVNPALEFERSLAYGMRLNIAAGTAVRFEPGEEKEVTLVAFGGRRAIYGHRGLVNGALAPLQQGAEKAAPSASASTGKEVREKPEMAQGEEGQA
jgi:urease beta subunit